MKKAIIYARHITYRKYEPDIATQIHNCQQYAERHNYDIVNNYFDISTKKLQSYPVFEQMKRDCKKEKFDAIIIYTQFMLGRNYDQTYKFINSMRKQGVKVIFVTDDNSPFKAIIEYLEKELYKAGGKKWKQQ